MNSKEYEAWLRADSMVISWILNSISKDIVDAFLYTNTAKELWMNLVKDLENVMVPSFTKFKEKLLRSLKEQ